MNGLALCCGVSPVFGTKGCAGIYTCPKCLKSASGWSTNQKWIASLWNKSFHKTEWIDKVLKYNPAPTLDIGESWRYAELRYVFHPAYGEKRETEDDFILFKISGRPEENWLKSSEGWEYIINKSRCLRGDIICKKWGGEEFILKAPELKSSNPVGIYLGRGWSTDNTWWYSLNVYTRNYKWHEKMTELLGINETRKF